MAQNADNIEILRPTVAGAAFSADSGTELPQSATASLAAFQSLGYISEDGIEMTINKESVDIKEMGQDTALTIQTSHGVEFVFKPLEYMNATVLKEMFGASNVTVSGDDVTSVVINSDELPEREFVFDMVGRNKRLMRLVVPRAKVESIGSIVYKGGEPTTGELTLKALADSNGNKVYKYFAKAE